MVDYFTHEREGGLDWHRNDRALRQEGYATDLTAAEAVDIIERHSGTHPFFLYVAFGAPHTPLDGRDCWRALQGDPTPVRDEILVNAAPGTGALRRGD